MQRVSEMTLGPNFYIYSRCYVIMQNLKNKKVIWNPQYMSFDLFITVRSNSPFLIFNITDVLHGISFDFVFIKSLGSTYSRHIDVTEGWFLILQSQNRSGQIHIVVEVCIHKPH